MEGWIDELGRQLHVVGVHGIDVIAHYMYVDLPVRPYPHQCSKPIQKQNPEEHYSLLENLMSAYHRK